MPFSNELCKESGTWTGWCGHGSITVAAGERFPECPGCRRGIDWRLARTAHVRPLSAVRQVDDEWTEEGWWPGKDVDT